MTCCICRGHFKAQGRETELHSCRKARDLREKLEHLQLKHPPMGERQPVTALDGMGRLAQENRILIKEKVNMMQDSGFLGLTLKVLVPCKGALDTFGGLLRPDSELFRRGQCDRWGGAGLELQGGTGPAGGWQDLLVQAWMQCDLLSTSRESDRGPSQS